MKRLVSLFLCVAFLFLFGCGQSNNGGDAISSTSSVSSEIASSSNSPVSSSTASAVSSTLTQPVKTVTVQNMKRLNINYNVDDIKALFNGNLVFETSKRSGEQTADHTIYSYNLKNQCASPIGTVQFFNTDSADFVIMKNNSCMYYCPLLFDKQGNNALIKADFVNKKVTYEKRFNFAPSVLTFFNKINDTEFLFDASVTSSEKKTEDTSDDWEIQIKKYNVDTKKETLVLKDHFDKSTQTGTLFVSICLKDDLIYSYTIKETAGKTEGVIEVYDLNGKLQKTMQIPQLESILKANKDDSVYSMKTFGNYFYFNTLNSLNLFYKYTDSGLKKLNLSLYPYMYKTITGNVTNDSAHNRMAYFNASNGSGDTAIGIFDTSTDQFKNVKIDVDGFQFIERSVVDEKGNAVVDLCKQKDANSKNAEHRYYYIEAEKLLNAQ